MKIFFSTLFDSTSYPLNIFMQNGVAVGAIHLGPAGLLHFLELHLGIPSPESNQLQRIFQYRNNLQKNQNGFYNKSFSANELDVATTLLNWRDELKLVGWNFKTDNTCPKRLKDLALAEKEILHAGFADRFRDVFETLKKHPEIPLEKIILHEPMELLPPFFQQLFNLFKGSGIEVEERETELSVNNKTDLGMLQDMVLNKVQAKSKNTLQKDGSIQILQFGELLSAANGLAALIAEDASFRPAIMNESGDTSLAFALRERGIPYTGQALHAASHPDLQLLAVIPVWLWKPYSPQQLLDFLLCPFNILPESLCTTWAGEFSENPGICLEDWMKLIEKYTAKIENENEKARPGERLQYLMNIGVEQSEKIPTLKIAEYYHYFYKIFNARCAVTNDEQEQIRLTRLCGLFKSFLSILNDYPEEEMDSLQLQQLINLILAPVSIVPYEKEAGSLHEINHPGLLAGECQDLLWFGFTASQSNQAVWSQWSGEELDWLASQGVHPDSSEVIAKRQFFFLTQWLRFVQGQLIFVIPSVVNGERAQPHSFQPFLDACFNNLYDITIHIEQPDQLQLLRKEKVKTDAVSVSTLPKFPGYWQVKNSHLLGRREKPESFHSLQKLLKYPYQWVLTYKAKLERGKTFCLPSMHMFYGTLSHEIFQKLLLMLDILTVSKPELKSRYTETALKLIAQQGMLLHVTGQEGALKTFREYLFEKFVVLLHHIKTNGWTVEDCEITRSRKFGDEEIEGRCDLLLVRKKGKELQKAVIDLKYQGERKYRLLMTGTEDLQLAIYSRIFHPVAKHCPTAYFIIKQGILFTSCLDAFKGGQIVNQKNFLGESYAELLHRMEATIRFRREELAQGKIEVGEENLTEDLDVFQLDEVTYILPDKKKDIKLRSAYNEYSTFIDTE